MVELRYLDPGRPMPVFDDDESWLMVEASDDGRFFGTGFAHKANGEAVFYASLAEDDVTLERAIKAAQAWAAKYDVGQIWIQASP